MERINLADAKAHLSELVTRASNGEEIEIVRRGKTVDWDALRRATEAMTPQEESAGDFIRRMRDSGPY